MTESAAKRPVGRPSEAKGLLCFGVALVTCLLAAGGAFNGLAWLIVTMIAA